MKTSLIFLAFMAILTPVMGEEDFFRDFARGYGEGSCAKDSECAAGMMIVFGMVCIICLLLQLCTCLSGNHDSYNDISYNDISYHDDYDESSGFGELLGFLCAISDD
jgi:hypothetical protein